MFPPIAPVYSLPLSLPLSLSHPPSLSTLGGLAAGEYFGEQALQNDAPRAANVKAVTDVTLFVLARKKFEEILGPLSAVLDRVIKVHIPIYLNML